MRTTIRLDDELLNAAKRRAVERGTTFTAVVEDALRQALAPRPEPMGEREPLPTYGRGGLRPGVVLDDSAALRDVMDGVDPS